MVVVIGKSLLCSGPEHAAKDEEKKELQPSVVVVIIIGTFLPGFPDATTLNDGRRQMEAADALVTRRNPAKKM